MPILYVAVFKGSVTAAEYSSISGNFNAVAKEFLTKAARNEGKFTYPVEGTTFNFLSRTGITFLCVADDQYGRILPGAFLDKLADNWAVDIGDKLPQPLREGQLNATYGAKNIKALVDKITAKPEEFDKLTAVKDKVNQAKDVMMTNMQSMIARDEQLHNLEDKTHTLLGAANEFQSSGRKLRTSMWWQNFKIKIIIGAALLLLALILFLVICLGVVSCFGGSGSSSSPSPSPSPLPPSPFPPSPSPGP